MIIDSTILNKNHLRIIITDSGLGGLSVQALLDNRLRELKTNTSFELIFYNSVAHHDYGYNTMTENDEKIRVFNSALNGMLKYKPDIILIACNTLSVLYHQTKLYEETNLPVIGLIDIGVDLILENIPQDDEYHIILYGTETTIASNKHKLKLLSAGIDELKITGQPCNDLESEIQIDPSSDKVKNLIGNYVNKSFSNKINKDKKIIVVLCCTHYGYSKTIFQETLNKKFNKEVCVLNPNEKMANVIVEGFDVIGNCNASVSNEVLSKVDINASEMNNLEVLLFEYSPSVVKALTNYKFDQSLFIV